MRYSQEIHFSNLFNIDNVFTQEEPLYYTVTNNPLDELGRVCSNPLEEYSSGYHGSSSVYTNSSTSSGGSTLPTNRPSLLLPPRPSPGQTSPPSFQMPLTDGGGVGPFANFQNTSAKVDGGSSMVKLTPRLSSGNFQKISCLE